VASAKEQQDPVARLWQEVEPWFIEELDEETAWLRDELGIMPAHGVRWTDLQPAVLDRAWAVIADRIHPPIPIVRWPDAMASPLPEVLSEGAFAAASRRYLPLCFDVEALTVANERLPTLAVTIDADLRRPRASGVGVSWRVNDSGWKPQTVAALAVLIGDLRNLLPAAPMTFDRQPEIIWRAIDAYLASR
jgi:hypothetical protein